MSAVESWGETPRRVPPHNNDAEQALLGAILVNNLAYGRVSEFLRPEHFGQPLHGEIYRSLAATIERGMRADPLTLMSHLKNIVVANWPELEAGGGTATYAARLAASATTIINAADYGRIVFDLHLRRQLIEIGEGAVNDAYDHDPESNAQAAMEALDQRLTALMSEGTMGEGLQPIAVGLNKAMVLTEAAYKRGGGVTGVPSGFSDLDARTGGFRGGNLIVIGARPAMGKSTISATIARNAARAIAEGKVPDGTGKGVAIFELEMSREELSAVLLAGLTGIAADRQLSGQLGEHEFERLDRARRRLAELPLYIDDTPGMTVAAIRARARAMKRRGQLGMIVVDYLQLVKPEGRRPSGNRTEDVSEITRGLKCLAKELDVPVVALSQLSRAVESRTPPRPQLSDLRESGSIEQDADVVIFLYRAEYYLERDEPAVDAKERAEWEAMMEACRDITELIVGKARMGRTGTVKIYYNASISRAMNLADRPATREGYQDE